MQWIKWAVDDRADDVEGLADGLDDTDGEDDTDGADDVEVGRLSLNCSCF